MSDGNKGIYVTFEVEAVELAFQSKEQGRPIYENREFVRICIAGDKHTEIYREASEYDKERFHEVYARFQRGLKDDEQMVGTPLKQWSAMSPKDVKEFNAVNIFTVEQLANISDTVKQRVGMGALEWSRKAKAFLDVAENGAAASKIAAENEKLRSELEALKEQMADFSRRIDEEAKRGPGRPPKLARETALEL